MKLQSFGNYPKIEDSKVFMFDSQRNLESYFKEHSTDLSSNITDYRNYAIPYGNGRSYGDSALSGTMLYTKNYDCFLSFDSENGILHAQSGVLLSEILEFCVPKGYFLLITPGTKYITLGGAIASNVHGKNHHNSGNFIECVQEFHLMLPNGEVKRCTRLQNSELFFATCGGMGLSGVILDAKITLKRIKSRHIMQQSIKTKNLQETFEVFESHNSAPYSVAWIDVLAGKKELGRSIVNIGDFCEDGVLVAKEKREISVPCFLPNFTLNSLSVKLFNTWYYQRGGGG